MFTWDGDEFSIIPVKMPIGSPVELDGYLRITTRKPILGFGLGSTLYPIKAGLFHVYEEPRPPELDEIICRHAQAEINRLLARQLVQAVREA